MSDTPNLPLSPIEDRRLAPVRKRARQKLTDLTQLPTPIAGRAGTDRDFLPDALRVIETPYPKPTQWTIICMCFALSVAFASAFVFHLTSYAIAPGQIVASDDVKVVEPLETGEILAVHVKDGDIVEQGQALLELDPAIALATQTVIVNKLAVARAETLRRRAEISEAHAEPVGVDPAIVWDSDIPEDVRDREQAAMQADLLQLSAMIYDLVSQRGVKQAAETSLASSIAVQKKLLEALTEQLRMRQKLETLGWDSHVKVLKGLEPVKEQEVALAIMQGEYNDAVAAIRVIDSQIALARETFVTGNVDKLAKLAPQIDDLIQQLAKAKLSVEAMTLRAPVSGMVTSTIATTRGQVVAPGVQILAIVPKDATLEVEAYALNTDIGFVREGAPVTVKVDTFKYTRFGTVAGKVIHVAPDAVSGSQALAEQKNSSNAPVSGSLSNTTAAQKTSDLVFPVTVALEKNVVEANGQTYPLTVGMSAIAEIETGRQSIIGYIMYPLMRVPPQK